MLRSSWFVGLVVLGIAWPLAAQDVAVRSPEPSLAVLATDARGALLLAQQWLVAHQEMAGNWDADGFMQHDTSGAPCDGPGNPTGDVAVTGLALLALAADGSDLRTGPQQAAIARGVGWLQAQQQQSGLFGEAASHDYIYGHAIATFAICELSSSGDAAVRAAAQRGLDHLEHHRNPNAVWRYQPRDGDNDTSVTSWCVAACAAGQRAGLRIAPGTFEAVEGWLVAVTDDAGRAGYARRAEPSSRLIGDHAKRFPPEKGEAMTAAALASRLRIGQTATEEPLLEVAAGLLLARMPTWDPAAGTIDEYYWYHGTQALCGIGGEPFAQWARQLGPMLVTAQRRDGHAKGSWDPIGVWGQSGGRVYATAILALALQPIARA